MPPDILRTLALEFNTCDGSHFPNWGRHPDPQEGAARKSRAEDRTIRTGCRARLFSGCTERMVPMSLESKNVAGSHDEVRIQYDDRTQIKIADACRDIASALTPTKASWRVLAVIAFRRWPGGCGGAFGG